MLPVTASHLILGFAFFFIGDVVPVVKISEAVHHHPRRKVALAPDGEYLLYKYSSYKEPTTALFPPDKRSVPLINHLAKEIRKDDGRNAIVKHPAAGSKCAEGFANEANKNNKHGLVHHRREHHIRRFEYLGSRPRQDNASVIRDSTNGDLVENITEEKENKLINVSNDSINGAVKNGLELNKANDKRCTEPIQAHPVLGRVSEVINNQIEGDLPDTGVMVIKSNLTTSFQFLYFIYNMFWNIYHRYATISGNKYYADYNKGNGNMKDQNEVVFWPYNNNNKNLFNKEAVGNKNQWSGMRVLNSYQGRSGPFNQDNYRNYDEDNSWWSHLSRLRFWSNNESKRSLSSGTEEHSNYKKNNPGSTKIVSGLDEIKNHQHPWYQGYRGYKFGYNGYNSGNIPTNFRLA